MAKFIVVKTKLGETTINVDKISFAFPYGDGTVIDLKGPDNDMMYLEVSFVEFNKHLQSTNLPIKPKEYQDLSKIF